MAIVILLMSHQKPVIMLSPEGHLPLIPSPDTLAAQTSSLLMAMSNGIAQLIYLCPEPKALSGGIINNPPIPTLKLTPSSKTTNYKNRGQTPIFSLLFSQKNRCLSPISKSACPPKLCGGESVPFLICLKKGGRGYIILPLWMKRATANW